MNPLYYIQSTKYGNDTPRFLNGYNGTDQLEFTQTYQPAWSFKTRDEADRRCSTYQKWTEEPLRVIDRETAMKVQKKNKR